jgi:hypothetical protein
VPIGVIGAQAAEVSKKLAPYGSEEDLEDLTLWNIDFYWRTFGIHVHPSPPRRLGELLPRIKRDDVVFDIDVDYFHEMQTECYSPLVNVEPGDLGHLVQVLDLIKKVKAPLITISEAKAAARKNNASTFNQLIEWLRKRRYAIESSELFEDDAEPERALQVFKEYWRTVREPLFAETGDPFSNEHLEKVRRETARFFSTKDCHKQ